MDLKIGKSIFIVLCLEYWGHNDWEVAIDPDVLELTDESIEYPPFSRGLGREGEDGGVRSNAGPDFHLGLPTPEVPLPLCAPHLQLPWPLVKVAGNEYGSSCSDPKHRVGLPASCSSQDKYGDGDCLCLDD